MKHYALFDLSRVSDFLDSVQKFGYGFACLRVVRDEDSSTGWKLVVGPFPGWETVPEW